MCKRVQLTAKEVEMEMQEARNADGFAGKMETDYISRMMKAFKNQKEIKSSIEVKYKARDDFEDLVFCSIHNRPLNTKNIIRSIKTASNRINEKIQN